MHWRGEIFGNFLGRGGYNGLGSSSFSKNSNFNNSRGVLDPVTATAISQICF